MDYFRKAKMSVTDHGMHMLTAIHPKWLMDEALLMASECAAI